MLLNTQEAAQLLGIQEKQIQRWVKDELIAPVKIASGRGGQHVFDMGSILSIALARDLRKRDYSLAEAGAVLNWLRSEKIDKLIAQCQANKRYLVLIGDADLYPRLMTPGEVRHIQEDLIAAHLRGAKVAIIDFLIAYQQFSSYVTSLRCDSPKQANVEAV